uniref:G-patch domain-containing protein n=1 Tax=Ditylenchus dipsaci TaxID=166011 RepID=A0A915DCP4_9BILA
MPPPPAPPQIAAPIAQTTSWDTSATSMVPQAQMPIIPPPEPTFTSAAPNLPPPPMAPVFLHLTVLDMQVGVIFKSLEKNLPIEAAKAKLEEGEIVEYKSTGMSVGSIGLPPPPPSEPQTWNQLSGQIFDPASIYAAQTTASATYEPVFPKPSAYSREWDQGKSSDLQHLTKGKTEAPLSVTDLVARRLRYSSRLKDDPNDFDAMKKINEIDEQMSEWAMSKNLPGQFIGSTGARVLSAKELAPTNQKFNAWAKKDLFRNAPELSSGVGMKLLQKMGWQCGQGLGREMQGQLEPLMLDVKSDRKGLQSTEDRKVSKRESVVDPSGKNPVSVVMEYCSKNRLGAPTFSCMELGPQNDKRFLWKAVLNGVEYEPSLPPPTRKLENLNGACTFLITYPTNYSTKNASGKRRNWRLLLFASSPSLHSPLSSIAKFIRPFLSRRTVTRMVSKAAEAAFNKELEQTGYARQEQKIDNCPSNTNIEHLSRLDIREPPILCARPESSALLDQHVALWRCFSP